MVALVWYPVAIAGGAAGVVGALFLHELAHAVPILLAGGTVSITVGDDDGRTLELGPLSVTVGFDGIRKTLLFGYYDYPGPQSKAVRAVSALAGPLLTVSIVAVVGASLLLRYEDGPAFVALQIVFLSELSRAVYTLVPMTYSSGPYAGWESDGKRFLRIVRS